jgi:hypothetical protein
VGVQVGDALADLVVHGDEGSIGLQAALDGARNRLDGGEIRLEQLVGQVAQRFEVGARRDQRVAVEDGPVIEEGDRNIVRINDVRRDLPADDRVENTS